MLLRGTAVRSRVPWRKYSTAVADRVNIVEVGPRDGLQNEKNLVPFETKMSLIEKLSSTGLKIIEAGAMVSPKWVPQVSRVLSRECRVQAATTYVRAKLIRSQMADSQRILAQLSHRPALLHLDPLRPAYLNPLIRFPFLIPNLQGLERALAVTRQADDEHRPLELKPNALREISIFIAATESFSKTNTNCTIAESLERVKPVFEVAKRYGICIRAYISVVLGCPYEGLEVSPSRVTDLSIALLNMGAYEISLGDTTGMGTVKSVRRLLQCLRSAQVPTDRLAVHLHDTYGQAVANAAVALEEGIRTFDSSVAGLGGCPYAKGATGNVATEDLVHFFHGAGLPTGVNLERLASIGHWISQELHRPSESRAGKAILARVLANPDAAP